MLEKSRVSLFSFKAEFILLCNFHSSMRCKQGRDIYLLRYILTFIPTTTTSFCWYSALLIMPASYNWTEYYFFMETHFKEKHIRYIFVRNFIHISQKYKKEQQLREWNRVGKKWDNIMPCPGNTVASLPYGVSVNELFSLEDWGSNFAT